MNSAFLAAGLSTRLKPITHRTPKPFLQFIGKPFLTHLIEQHQEAGVDPKYIVISPSFKDLFKNYFLNFDLLTQDKPLGTADAARIALQASGKPLLVQYGDNLVLSSAVRRLSEAHRGQVATGGGFTCGRPHKVWGS